MRIFGAEMNFGVGTKGLDESLSYLSKTRPDVQFPLVQLDDIKAEIGPFQNLKRLDAVREAVRRIKAYSSDIIESGETPLFVGGDHAAAIGTVAASIGHFPNEGLVWIDAHPDIHRPETSHSGNIHGMPTAVMMGQGEESLVALFESFVPAEKVVMLGLRDIDGPEAIHLKEWGVKYYTWETIERQGLEAVLEEVRAYLQARDVQGLHISLDIDGMDPVLMPGVSVPVKDGFRPAEAEYIISYLSEAFALNALDVVEYNYLRDKNEQTGDWLADFLRQRS